MTSASRLKAFSKVGTTVIQRQDSFEGVVAGSVFDSAQRWRKIAEVVDLGELFADRARVRDVPGMRARSRRTVCDRDRSRRTICDRARHGLAGSTGTKKVPQMPKSRNRTGTRLPKCTTRLPSFHKLELKGECDESDSTNIHRKCGQDARFSSWHTSVSCVCRLNVATWQPIVVNLATKRTSTRCVCRLNAAWTWTQERKSSSFCHCSNCFLLRRHWVSVFRRPQVSTLT